MNRKKFLQWSALIALVFLAARAIYFNQLLKSNLLNLLILDSDYYHRWAVSLATGHGNPEGPFWLSPLYPYFMAAIFKAAASLMPSLIVILQFVLSFGTLLLMGQYTRKLFGDAAALIACALAALYGPWLYYDGMILGASLGLFINALIIYFLIFHSPIDTRNENTWVRAEKNLIPYPSSLILFFIGLLCGLSALIRPSILIFAVLLSLLIFLQKNPRRVQKILLLFVGIFIVLSPVLIRNWKISGSPILTTSSGGINFFIGNREGATGVYDELNFVKSFDAEREAEGYRAEASRAEGRELSLNEASRFWAKQAFRDILQNPVGWIKLLFKKLWLTVQNGEIANNLSFRGVNMVTPVTKAMPLRWGLLFPFAVAGAFLLWRQKKNHSTLLLYGAAYLLVNLIFFSSSEYRFPLLLILFPFAAAFFTALWKMLEQKEVRDLVYACAVYLLCLVVVNFPSKEVNLITRPKADFYDLALACTDRGFVAEAIPYFTRALALDGEYKNARVGLAEALWSLGNYDDARDEFARAGVAPPDTVSGSKLEEFLQNIYLLTEDDNYEGALAELDRAFPENGNAPLDVWSNRAMIENRLGLHRAAYNSMMRAHQKDPVAPEYLYYAGRYLQIGGDTLRADSLYGEALKLYSAYVPARLALGFNALARSDVKTAQSQLDEIARIKIPVDTVGFQAEQLGAEIEQFYSDHPK